MDHRTLVNSLFQAIASSLGFQVTLGNKNLCNIKRKSTDEETIVELPSNGEILYIYTVIGDVPFDNREKVFEFILRLNLHGHGTNRGMIGIDAKTNKFVLSHSLLIRDLNEQLLLQWMREFFSTASQLREKLLQFFQIQTNLANDMPHDDLLLSPNLNLVI
ncbi:MAG: CesT family type III secretion system chaperone [Puniceicoccales bacterium]|jgi:hypothetical protein|nr:CesT family type III secretion system chaperone [Puniceicoccales bacterium]